MVRKLTLSIDDDAVQKAKRISRKSGKSISRMVEEFINSLPEEEEELGILKIQKMLKDKIHVPEERGNKASVLDDIDKLMEKYRDRISIPADGDYKKMIGDWRYEEYMKSRTEGA